MKIVMIRACKRDDYIARLCYESWKLSGFDGRIILFSEDYKSNWFQNINIEILKRSYCDNFAGQTGAMALLNGFKSLNFDKSDIVVSCDADVVVKEDPTKEMDFDFGGIGGIVELGTGRYIAEEENTRKMKHISGQMLIFKGSCLCEAVCDSSEDIRNIYQKMKDDKISFADDTYLSYRMSLIDNIKIKFIRNKWQHFKHYELEGRTDWNEIIKNIQL